MVRSLVGAEDTLRQQIKLLLTRGFYAIDEDGVILEGVSHQEALAATKPWRGEVWKAFRQLEARLWPDEEFL